MVKIIVNYVYSELEKDEYIWKRSAVIMTFLDVDSVTNNAIEQKCKSHSSKRTIRVVGIDKLI